MKIYTFILDPENEEFDTITLPASNIKEGIQKAIEQADKDERFDEDEDVDKCFYESFFCVIETDCNTFETNEILKESFKNKAADLELKKFFFYK